MDTGRAQLHAVPFFVKQWTVVLFVILKYLTWCTKLLNMKFLIASVLLLVSFSMNAQNADSVAAAQRRALLEKNKDRLIYPVVKGSVSTGVIPVTGVTEPVDPSLHYKILFDFTEGTAAQYKEGTVNPGLEEICRMVNLHYAAGIKKEKIQIVIILHSAAVMTVINNDEFRKRFGRDNQNLDLIGQLEKLGTRFIVCGQTATLREIPDASLLPGVKKAYSARTALSTYNLKGFYSYVISGGH